MNKLTYWIKGHQITAFFIITFAITWGLGFSYGAAQIKWAVAYLRFGRVWPLIISHYLHNALQIILLVCLIRSGAI